MGSEESMAKLNWAQRQGNPWKATYLYLPNEGSLAEVNSSTQGREQRRKKEELCRQ